MCRMYGGLLMTVPSTEELQRLLNEATPGPWEWDETVGLSLYFEDAEGKGRDIIKCAARSYPDEADAEIIAHSRAIAAEVIRLREEIKSLREHYRGLEKGYDDASIPFSPGRWFSHNAVQDLTRILEGDQK